MSHVMNSV